MLEQLESETIFRIILPLSRPALTALAVISFAALWNDLLAPLMMLGMCAGMLLPHAAEMALRFRPMDQVPHRDGSGCRNLLDRSLGSNRITKAHSQEGIKAAINSTGLSLFLIKIIRAWALLGGEGFSLRLTAWRRPTELVFRTRHSQWSRWER